ncbi:hypothetical protein BH11CYA1_BH11CYA1_01290 [soil metagenome]
MLLPVCRQVLSEELGFAVRIFPKKISGPFTSSNLSIFLIHGKDNSKFQQFLTLQEALSKGQVTVKETGQVNQLAIQNTGSMAVFVQSGDIVKGGRQDRTMQYDMILAPKSGLVPINSFFVEHDRWSKRGAEDATAFKNSNYQLANKSLKMAAKYSGSQQQVWDSVARFSSLGFAKAHVSPAQAMASPSPSSLQLALENDQVKASTEKYVHDLEKVVYGHSDVVGYAFAINGKINSVDVYANNALFKKMWPKLINSSAAEALTESEAGKKFAIPKPAAVQECIADAERGQMQEKATSGKARLVQQETSKNVLFETRMAESKSEWLHRNYMTK